MGRLVRGRGALRAEIVFLRKQLGMFAERVIPPRRATKREKITPVLLAKLFCQHIAAACRIA